jgi:hypothetical protein
MGDMKRAIAREKQESAGKMEDQKRMTSTLVIAASIIAAVRLVRDDISKPTERVTAVITDSVGLARMILDKIALR